MRSWWLGCALSVPAAAFGQPSPEPSTNAKLRVVVVDSEGIPLPNAEVGVKTAEGRLVDVTDDVGVVVFRDLGPGAAFVRVKRFHRFKRPKRTWVVLSASTTSSVEVAMEERNRTIRYH